MGGFQGYKCGIWDRQIIMSLLILEVFSIQIYLGVFDKWELKVISDNDIMLM